MDGGRSASYKKTLYYIIFRRNLWGSSTATQCDRLQTVTLGICDPYIVFSHSDVHR